jgi:hypothetical protein
MLEESVCVHERSTPSSLVHDVPQVPYVPDAVLCDGHQLGDGHCVMGCGGT